jgi:hypothetical protein
MPLDIVKPFLDILDKRAGLPVLSNGVKPVAS